MTCESRHRADFFPTHLLLHTSPVATACETWMVDNPGFPCIDELCPACQSRQPVVDLDVKSELGIVSRHILVPSQVTAVVS